MPERDHVWFDAEGDFQDTTNYVDVFREILDKAGITGATVEDGWASDDVESGFSITVTAGGKTFRFVSEEEAAEWADVPFLVDAATQLGAALGFTVKEISTGDQTVKLRVVCG